MAGFLGRWEIAATRNLGLNELSDLRLHLGLSDDEFYGAVPERAKEEAAFMDEYAAEEHVSTVGKAIESAPGIKHVDREGND
jgi:hypothetical protein